KPHGKQDARRHGGPAGEVEKLLEHLGRKLFLGPQRVLIKQHPVNEQRSGHDGRTERRAQVREQLAARDEQRFHEVCSSGSGSPPGGGSSGGGEAVPEAPAPGRPFCLRLAAAARNGAAPVSCKKTLSSSCSLRERPRRSTSARTRVRQSSE